jgi:hypothetical protein
MTVGVMVHRIINQQQKVAGIHVLMLVLEHGLSGYQHVNLHLISNASTDSLHLVTLYSLTCLIHAMMTVISRYNMMCNYLNYTVM